MHRVHRVHRVHLRLEEKDQIRSGTDLGCLGAWVPWCLGAGAEGAEVPGAATEIAGSETATVAVTGRAASIVGHSLISTAEIWSPSFDGSCVGQCGLADCV